MFLITEDDDEEEVGYERNSYAPTKRKSKDNVGRNKTNNNQDRTICESCNI